MSKASNLPNVPTETTILPVAQNGQPGKLNAALNHPYAAPFVTPFSWLVRGTGWMAKATFKAYPNIFAENVGECPRKTASSVYGMVQAVVGLCLGVPIAAKLFETGRMPLPDSTLGKIFVAPLEALATVGAGMMAIPLAVTAATAAVLAVWGLPAGALYGTYKAGRHLVNKIMGVESGLQAQPEPAALPGPTAAPVAEPAVSTLPKLRLPDVQLEEQVGAYRVKGYGPDVQVALDAAKAMDVAFLPFEEAGEPDAQTRIALAAHLGRVAGVLHKLHITDENGSRTNDLLFFRNARNETTGQLERHVILPSNAPRHVSSVPYAEYLEVRAEVERELSSTPAPLRIQAPR